MHMCLAMRMLEAKEMANGSNGTISQAKFLEKYTTCFSINLRAIASAWSVYSNLWSKEGH